LNSALYWLAGRPLLAAALGAVGGPLAYFGGVGLGALAFPGGLAWALALIAVEWAIAMPLLLGLNRWAGRRFRRPRTNLDLGVLR
jgi:membrane protein implicated in regulation of membrane protease activity